jgi:hypothetical protein
MTSLTTDQGGWPTPGVAQSQGNEGGGPIQRLLDRKIDKAKEALIRDMNRTVFGPPPALLNHRATRGGAPSSASWIAPKSLRGIIGEAYDLHVVDETSEMHNHQLPAYNQFRSLAQKQIADQLFRESPLIAHLSKNAKEKTMHDEEIARKAVTKRKEERAGRVAEEVGEFFESSAWENGDTVSWYVEFTDTPDKTYHYVAVKGGTRWYITGDPTKYSTDDIVEKIVTLSLKGTVVGGWASDD